MGDRLRGTMRLAESEMGERTEPAQAVRVKRGGFLCQESSGARCCFLMGRPGVSIDSHIPGYLTQVLKGLVHELESGSLGTEARYSW